MLHQDVYSVVYTDANHSVSVEVFKCSEDTSSEREPWKGAGSVPS